MHLGVILHIGFQQQVIYGQSVGVVGADAQQRVSLRTLQVPEPGQGAPVVFQSRGDQGVHGPARRRGADAPGHPVKQRRAEFGLQIADDPGDHRPGDLCRLRGGGDVAQLVDLGKVFHLQICHKGILPYLFSCLSIPRVPAVCKKLRQMEADAKKHAAAVKPRRDV